VLPCRAAFEPDVLTRRARGGLTFTCETTPNRGDASLERGTTRVERKTRLADGANRAAAAQNGFTHSVLRSGTPPPGKRNPTSRITPSVSIEAAASVGRLDDCSVTRARE
jgi:hypothetical protein